MRFVTRLALTLLVASKAMAEGSLKYPVLTDGRLEISLYASDPDIVTPIDAAVDSQGRLYVIESHTHSPPRDYDGPKGDRIKVFQGTRPDGYAQHVGVFAEDLFQAQSIAFAPDGTLYAVCTRAVFALYDRDGDGRADERVRVVTLEPYEKRANPHGQLQGIAFSTDGWMYVGRGAHVGGDYEWRGTDGRRLAGGYDGGDIVRARPDGTQLERVATGFWNPFALAIDRQGRVLAIDNDPDARGPNRLLHIVRGGDYGYKLLFGRFGLHPYQAWEGELPGTLPMIAGVGEAPTGLIDASTARLPPDYQGSLLVSVWGEHNLSLYRTSPQGCSLRSQPEIFLQGEGSDDLQSPFRPAGLATAPDGAIYITDWMLIDYTTHKRGRIWKVTARPGVKTVDPRPVIGPAEPGPELQRLEALYGLGTETDYQTLRNALAVPDPFIRSAAVAQLAQPVFREAVIRDLQHTDSRIRLGALLALRMADVQEPERFIRPRLRDPDMQVVQTAMIWAGEKVIRTLHDEVDQVAARPDLDKSLFETWLATMQILQHEGLAELYAMRTPPDRIRRTLRPNFIEELVHDEGRPVALRTFAMRWLADVEKPHNHELLARLAASGPPALRLEAIRRLGTSRHPDGLPVLRSIALDPEQPSDVRAEALVGLSASPDGSLVELLDDNVPEVRIEAARALRPMANDPKVRAALEVKLSSVQDDSTQTKLARELEFLLGAESVQRPGSVEGWQTLLAEGGDVDAGRRVFFSPNTACNECHAAEGRGGVLGTEFSRMPFGPDLSRIGRSAGRGELIESIIAPSRKIAPEMQGWVVTTHSGEVFTGRQIDQEARSIQLIMTDGREHDIARDEIASWGPMRVSLMPENLASLMSVEQLRDLVAYLESLK